LTAISGDLSEVPGNAWKIQAEEGTKVAPGDVVAVIREDA
jgi:biotin carboxyl carrier protein